MRCLASWAGIGALFTSAVAHDLVPLLPATVHGWHLRANAARALSAGLVSALFLAGERLIRRHAWRSFRKDLDLQGDWLGETFYDHLEQPTDEISLEDFAPFRGARGKLARRIGRGRTTSAI